MRSLAKRRCLFFLSTVIWHAGIFCSESVVLVDTVDMDLVAMRRYCGIKQNIYNNSGTVCGTSLQYLQENKS